MSKDIEEICERIEIESVNEENNDSPLNGSIHVCISYANDDDIDHNRIANNVFIYMESYIDGNNTVGLALDLDSAEQLADKLKMHITEIKNKGKK